LVSLCYLQALDHGDDLHQGKLLLAGVVVSGGSLVLLGVVGTLLVGVLIRGMDQLPRVLHREGRQVRTRILDTRKCYSIDGIY
jgi:hypothetical protein